VAMIVLHSLPYIVGDKIVLKVVPVDPRDYFRGDFVVLSYDVNARRRKHRRPSRRSATGVAAVGPDAYLEDRTVNVTVEPDVDGRTGTR